jgi:hypothetical protein
MAHLLLVMVVMAELVLHLLYQELLLFTLAVVAEAEILVLVALLLELAVMVVVVMVAEELMVLPQLLIQAVEVVVAVKVVEMELLAVQESSLFPTHLQLNYSVVELLLYQAVNIFTHLLHLAH